MKTFQLLLIAFCTFALIDCKTVIVAHRGDSAAAPENTLPAFALGFENGANAFETDLRTSSDGYIVRILFNSFIIFLFGFL